MAGVKGKTKYSLELAEKICEGIIDLKFLYEVCREVGIDRAQVYRWKNVNHKMYKPEFADMLREAFEIAGDKRVRKCLNIVYADQNLILKGTTKDGREYEKANNADVQDRKLKAETEKWAAGQLNRMWGPLNNNVGGGSEQPVVVQIVNSFPVEEKAEKKDGDRLAVNRISKEN